MPEGALGLVNLTPHDVVLDLGGGQALATEDPP